MRVSFIVLGLGLFGCSQNATSSQRPADAGLPADVHALAPAPLMPPFLTTTEDLGGVSYTSAAQTTVAIALPVDTPSLTQALWIRQVMQVLPDLSLDGTTVSVAATPGLAVWTLHAPPQGQSSAVRALLGAIAQPQLSDNGLAGALSTRPHSSDPADPATLRALHEHIAVRHRLWIAAPPEARAAVTANIGSWDAGEPATDGEAWLTEYAHQAVVSATCRVDTLGSAPTDVIRRVAQGAVDRRTAGIATLHAWRAGTSDTRDALHRAIDTASATPADCAAR